MLAWVTSANVPDQVPWPNPKPKDKKVHCVGETEKLHDFSEWNAHARDIKGGPGTQNLLYLPILSYFYGRQ